MDAVTPKTPLDTYLDHLAGAGDVGTETELADDELRTRLGPSPYVGLRFFDGRTKALLAARDRASSEIRERFESQQTVVVVGGSGSGKSSVVQGRVVSEISAQTNPVKGRDGPWYSVTFRPVTNPCDQFANALWRDVFEKYFYGSSERDNRQAVDKLADVFGEGTEPAVARKLIADDIFNDKSGSVERHHGFAAAQAWVDSTDFVDRDGMRTGPANLLILIDQFEEIFRKNVDPDQAKKLFAMIRHVHEKKPPSVFLILTMRSEDLHRCAQAEGLPDLVNDSLYFVDWLDRDQLREAVVRPAQKVLREWGVPFDRTATAPFDEKLVETLLNQVDRLQNKLEHKADHLPLLQHGLGILWQNAAKRLREESIGRLEGVNRNEALFTVTEKDLPSDSHKWLGKELNKTADKVFADAKDRFDAEVGSRKVPGANAEIALRAALCEMANLDENRRYHREFVTVGEVIEKRFPHMQGDNGIKLEGAISSALDHFADEGLLVAKRGKTITSYDVVHEALIRNWKKLSEWVSYEFGIVEAVIRSVKSGIGDNLPKLDQVFGQRSSIVFPGHNVGYQITFTENWLKEAVARAAIGDQGGNPKARIEAAETKIDLARKKWRTKRRKETGYKFLCVVAVISAFAAVYAYSMSLRSDKEAALHKQRAGLATSILLGRDAEPEQRPMPLALRNLSAAYAKLSEHLVAGDTPEELLARHLVDERIRQVMSRKLHVRQGGRDQTNADGMLCRVVDQNGNSFVKGDIKGHGLSIGLERPPHYKFVQLSFAVSSGVGDKKNQVPVIVDDSSGQILSGKEGTSICLSRDNQVLTLSYPGYVAPVVYRLRILDTRADGSKKPKKFVSAVKIESERYPEIPKSVSQQAKRSEGHIGRPVVTSIGPAPKIADEDLEGNESKQIKWRREITYELAGKRFTAFFYEGLTWPVRISETAGFLKNLRWHSNQTSSGDGALNWCRDRNESCSSTRVEGPKPGKTELYRASIFSNSADRPNVPNVYRDLKLVSRLISQTSEPDANDNYVSEWLDLEITIHREIGEKIDGNVLNSYTAVLPLSYMPDVEDVGMTASADGNLHIVLKGRNSELYLYHFFIPSREAIEFLSDRISTDYRSSGKEIKIHEASDRFCHQFDCRGILNRW